MLGVARQLEQTLSSLYKKAGGPSVLAAAEVVSATTTGGRALYVLLFEYWHSPVIFTCTGYVMLLPGRRQAMRTV
jgi:hypothetical protein